LCYDFYVDLQVKSHDITDDFVEQHSKQSKTTAKPCTNDDDDFVKTPFKKRKRKSREHQSKEKGKVIGNKFLSLIVLMTNYNVNDQ